jgi:hypothetical protein
VSSRCKQTTPSLWPKPKPDGFPRPVSVSSCYRVPQRTTALSGGVLGGRSWVGITSTAAVLGTRHTSARLPARMAMPDQALEDLARRCRSNSAEQDRQCEWHSQTGHERTRFGHAARTRQGMARASTWRARVALPAPGRCSVRWGRVRFELVHCESRHRKLGWIGVGVETVRLRSYASSGRSTHPAIRIRPEGRWRAR